MRATGAKSKSIIFRLERVHRVEDFGRHSLVCYHPPRRDSSRNAAAVALPLYTALYRSMPLPPVRQVRFLHSIATRCLEPLRKKRTEVIDLVADFETLRQHAEQVKPPVLDEFCCPLPMELMVEPVSTAAGQTYERASIEAWLKHSLPATCRR